MSEPRKCLRLPAIELMQSGRRMLYSFVVDGKLIPEFATVSRIRRTGAELQGYQRPEVLSHVAEIRAYLESSAPMIPNAIVLAFDSSVTFEPGDVLSRDCTYASQGTLVIPLDGAIRDEEKPGFIVDGQQRIAAIREARITGFPIPVTAFITNDVREQTEQFILVNSTKPLPKGLIYELLPGTDALLPTQLHRRRLPSALLSRLNADLDSPMFGLIATPTTPDGIVKDNSVLRMIEHSLSDGLLYRFRDPIGSDDLEAMLIALKRYWTAVREVFRESWALPPRRSRLLHGAGLISLGFVMDAIGERYRASGLPTSSAFEGDLRAIKSVCRWTDGYWDFGGGQKRKWNEIQNTSKDIRLLTNHLLIQYRELVWNRASGEIELLSM